MESRLFNFIKRNYKFLSVLTLNIILGIIIITQVSFKTPDQVSGESVSQVSLVEDTEEGQTVEPEFEIQESSVVQVVDSGVVKESQNDSVGEQNNVDNNQVVNANQGVDNSDNQSYNNIDSGNHTEVNSQSTNSDNTNSSNQIIDTGNNTDSNNQSGNTDSQESETTSDDKDVNTGGSSGNQSSSSQSMVRVDAGQGDESFLDYIGSAWRNANKPGGRYVSLSKQSVDSSKQITVYVTVDCSQILQSGVVCNDQTACQYVPEDGKIVPRCRVTCSSGENVWDAVARVLNTYSIDYAYTGDPPFTHDSRH